MAIRLLSFLAQIERSLVGSSQGAAWEVMRTVNYQHNLARMTVAPLAGSDTSPRGSIFLQGFSLADGAVCMKANLAWDGSTALSVISIFAEPSIDWTAEASRVASAWLAGPPAPVITLPTRTSQPHSHARPALAVAAG